MIDFVQFEHFVVAIVTAMGTTGALFLRTYLMSKKVPAANSLSAAVLDQANETRSAITALNTAVQSLNARVEKAEDSRKEMYKSMSKVIEKINDHEKECAGRWGQTSSLMMSLQKQLDKIEKKLGY